VKVRQNKGLDFVIDKLTNSIENVQSGDSFPTLTTANALKLIDKYF
jgi:hypothetical protein